MIALFQLLTATAPAYAQADFDAAEEVVVWGDLFARWDDTRWLIITEIGVPYTIDLARDENEEFQSRFIQVRAVFACDKDWKLSRRKYEVQCEIEDFGMKAAIAERRVSEGDTERAQRVLDEIDAKLTGAAMELQVADDGRVLNINLEGVPRQNRRQSKSQETLRQIMSRLITGYNLKLQKYNQLHEGKWVEYNSSLMAMPLPPDVGGAMGSNMLVHYLNRYRGQVIVQSIGKGVTVVDGANFETDLIGVSLFDQDQGFMTERVWALTGKSTASTFFATRDYFNAGRVAMLAEADRPDVGKTEVVNGPGQYWPGLPKWEPIERPD